MSNRIRAYFRLQRIRKAECEEWEKFIKEVRMKSLQDRNDKRSTGNDKGYNAYCMKNGSAPPLPKND
jgi:hypothetical protein